MLRSWTGGDDRAGQAARPSRFQVRPIGRKDEAVALEALDRNPVRDVFIASRILHDGALTTFGPSPLWGAFEEGQLRGMLHVGPNLVPATDDQAAPATPQSRPKMRIGSRTRLTTLSTTTARTT